MIVLETRNVHQALPIALDMLRYKGVRRDSRNGEVVMFPQPFTTVYRNPEECVLFWKERNANPFFHLAEALWMLAGQNDVASMAYYVKRMESFSDDGNIFHGAYGHRWRYHFGLDQIPLIVDALKKNPDDRRQVLQMWDCAVDLGRDGRDVPCNLLVVFQINTEGKLDMTVTNRSNDLIWGAYGANAVHFSFLQQYVAGRIGVDVGRYYQVSTNTHAYVNVLETVKSLAEHPKTDPLNRTPWGAFCPYESGEVSTFPLFSNSDDIVPWHYDLAMYVQDPKALGFKTRFFRRVAIPMYLAHMAFKGGSFEDAFEYLEEVEATDWKLAGADWLSRRQEARKNKGE